MTGKKVREKPELTSRQKKLWSIGFILFLIILWQVISMIIGKAYILPGPLKVIESLWKNKKEIFIVHLPATLEVMAIGCGCSLVLGTLLAVVMDMHRIVERAVYPVLTFTQTVPVVCIAPVFVLWFGYSVGMRVVVVVLLTFFPVTVNLFDGFRSTRPERTELLKTYGAGKWQQMRLLRWPSALPNLFTALHVAVPWSAVGAAIAEWLGAPKGLGTFSRSCMSSLDAAGLLAPLLLLTVIALLLNLILNVLERIFTEQ